MFRPLVVVRLAPARAGFARVGLALALALALTPGETARAQSAPPFDAAWYRPGPSVKIGVVRDGVYRITGAEIAGAGFPLAGTPADRLEIVENGRAVPFLRLGSNGPTLAPSDTLVFVGRRNRGDAEGWAYDAAASQSSPFYSLYSDTTFYWLRQSDTPGRRYQTLEPLAAPPAPLAALTDTVHVEDENVRYDGDSENSGHPLYTRGEAKYMHGYIRVGAAAGDGAEDVAVNVALPGLAAGATDSLRIRARLSSGSASRHRVALRVGADTTLVDAEDWNGYAFRTLTGAVAAAGRPAETVVRVRFLNRHDGVPFTSGSVGSAPNQVFLDFVEVSYPRALRAREGRDRFAAPGGAVHLRLSGYAASARVLAFAPEAGRFAVLNAAGGEASLTGTLPAAGAIVWTAEAGALLAPARIRGYATPALATLAGADYVLVTTAALRPSADALAAYHRAQSGFTVAVVDQGDVFSQFDYGRPTPLAIRRFTRMTQAWARPARYLMLWGDALAADRARPLAPWEVVTFGNAPSDAWYAMQRNAPNDWTEFIAIGRAPVRTNAAGEGFARKLDAYEHAAAGTWQRRGMFIAGGENASERSQLRGHQLRWAGRAGARPTAMDTLLLFKSSNFIVDGVYRERIRDEVRAGVSWLSFFGHSSTQLWEVLTDPPQEFDNATRLPVVLSLGCRTGAFTIGSTTDDALSLSEQLVVAGPNGSIAHWGSSELTTISAAAQMSNAIHQLIFTDTLRVLGDVIREAKRRYAVGPGAFDGKNLLQYSLIGDPATRYHLPAGPDFHLDASSIAFSREAPAVADGALGVRVTIRNHGLVPPDSVALSLTHTAPGGARTAYARRVAAVVDTLSAAFTLPLTAANAGENRVEAVADADGRYAEADETDNRAERRTTVFAAGLALASPTVHGITGRTPTLRVTPSSLGGAAVPVVFELDTTRTFGSPAVRRFTASGTASADWAPGALEEGRTYHWRARVDEAAQADVWTEGRFTVRSDLTAGFLAQRADLAETSVSEGVRREAGAWAFDRAGRYVQIAASGSGAELKGQITVGSTTYLPVTLGWGVVVLDGASGAVRAALSLPTYTMPADLQLLLNTNRAKARAQLDSLSRTVRPGDYVLARTRFLGNAEGPAISEDVRASMRRLGSTAVDTLDYTDYWLMIARVGDPAQRFERALPAGITNETVKDTTLFFAVGEGTVTTARVGPARRWERASAEAVLAGTAALTLDVLDGEGTSVLIQGTPGGLPVDLAALDARAHPYVRLRARLADPARLAPPQLNALYALYDAVPELGLDGGALALSADSVGENEPLRVSVPVVNLSAAGSADALVRYFVTDAANRERLAATDTLRGLAPGTRRTSTVTLATAGLVGRNRLRVVAEQRGPDGRVFAEPIATNNVLLTTFSVRGDAARPTFTVRIDGEALPNDPGPVRDLRDERYPFVSARPTIEVVARDENAFRPLADTALAVLTLDGRRIRFSNPSVQFQPATGAQPDARIVFTPDLTRSDTTHTLTLRVYDASGNEAVGSPYQVHFRIARTMAVESVLPYPNPMHTSTTFAFRVRGADAGSIEECRLRIFTVSGQLVREFDLVRDGSGLDGGALRIGWNKLRWDGTDADGDPLSTGVYLYRVTMRAEGEPLDMGSGSGVERLVIVR